MLTICKDEYACLIHRVDVLEDGLFDKLEEAEQTRRIPSEAESARQFWNDLKEPVGIVIHAIHEAEISGRPRISEYKPCL